MPSNCATPSPTPLDGATVAIYYESPLAKLRLKDEDLPVLDAEVDELAEDEEDGAQARLKRAVGPQWKRWWVPNPALRA